MDRFARTFAGGVSRRDALRKIGVAMVGGAGATVALTGPADAASSKCGRGLTACCNTTCGVTCFNLSNDLNNCGACGHACPAPMGGTATCTSGVCGGACGSGLTLCNGACVNLTSDSHNCGSCGTVCGSGNCTSGSCGASLGSQCTTDSQCASGHCAQNGICCSAACIDEGGCGTTGACNQSGTGCANAPGGTECVSPSCSNGVQTSAAFCAGDGTTCPPPVMSSCGAYACGVTACKTSCVTAVDCAAGFTCSSGQCVTT